MSELNCVTLIIVTDVFRESGVQWGGGLIEGGISSKLRM
jgi:hypothetical protein